MTIMRIYCCRMKRIGKLFCSLVHSSYSQDQLPFFNLLVFFLDGTCFLMIDVSLYLKIKTNSNNCRVFLLHH